MDELQAILNDLRQTWGLSTLVQLVIIVIATIIALRFVRVVVNVALDRLFQREATEGTAKSLSELEVSRRRAQLEWLLYRALRVIVWVIAFLMVLQVLQLDIGPAIVSLGFLGLALSLGAQSLVKDYVGGAFILIENQYNRGDVVTIGGVTGTVEDVSLRRTSLRDVDGTVHTVPHGLIEVTSNLTRNWSNINLDIPVSYDLDIRAVIDAINDVGDTLAADPDWKDYVIEPPKVARIDALKETGLMLKVLGSVEANHRAAAAGELRRRILVELERRQLYVGWRPNPNQPAPAVASEDHHEEDRG